MEETGTRVLACSPNLPGAMDRQSWTLQDYRITNTLYSGYAAQVYTATCRYSGMEVVLKVYNDVNKAPDVAQHEMYREVAIQSSLQHHNIVHLFAAFQEGQTLVLVQEYAPGGDLLGLMAAHGGRADEATVVKTVLRPLLEALLYLHRWGIVHRDVKPENVLFAADGTVKLADFGLAINMVEERPVSRVGTLDYMAPEVLRCPIKQHMGMAPGPTTPARYGFATDCWAVGVVTFELLTGLPPYASDCRYQAEARIIAAAPPPFPHGMSHPARDFIRRLLAPIPGDRPTVRQLLAHPWILDPEACVSAHLHHQHAHAVSSASAHHYYHPLPQHSQHTGCSPLATAGGAATASSLSATAYSHAAAHVHAYAGAAAAYSPYGSAHAQAQAAVTSASVHATASHQAQQQQQPSTSGGDATCSVAAGRTAVAHGLEQQPCAAGKQPSASAAAATQHAAAAADPMLLSSYSTLPYTQASAAAAAAAAHQHHVHAMAASHPHPGAYHSSYHYHGSHGALNTPPSQAASPAAPAAPQATLSIPTFSTGKHLVAHPHPHSHPQAPHQPQPHQPHHQPAASAAPAAAESHPDPAVRQLNEQLRALQQHQLLDLSKLPLDQIQGVIAKLQEAMRIAVAHQQQQQQQQQHAHCSTDGGITAASAAASPAPTAPSAVSAAAARAAAVGTADVQMEEAADVGASQTGACGSAAAPAAAAAATPVASGSCVHSSCHSPHSPLSVARRNAAAATASTGGAAPYVQQAPHEPQSAATPFAFAASLASHILHHASTAMTAAVAAGSDSASHASTTTPVGFGAHAGPSSSSLTASRRTTAEATGPAIACCQGALTAEAVTAALLGMAHQQFQQHQQGTSAAATPAPAQCGSSQAATPHAAVFEATLHSHSRAHAHAHTPLVIPAPPAAAPASTSAGGAVPMDRASGGGGVHDGDGLVYVSIGSSRKLPAGSVGGAPPTQALVVVGGNDAAAAGAGAGGEDELQRAARQVAATWFQQQPQQQQQLAAAAAAMS